MKRSVLVAVCIIALCSLLAVPLSGQPASPSPTVSSPPSQAAPHTGPQSQVKLTPNTASNASSHSTQPETVLPTVPENPFVTTPQPQQTFPQTAPSVSRNLQQAVGNATNYFGQTQEPYALLQLNVLYRRFGVIEFANALQRYDQILGENPENAPLLRIFRRIADNNNTLQPEDFYAVTADVDRITVPALYSDRGSLPDTYLSELNVAANSGGYMLTHALLAAIWLQDNNCDPGYDFKEAIYRANAGLINGDPVVTDLELEAAAFLYVAGQGSLVDGAFVQLVIDAQNYDGGWSYSSDSLETSNWHTSVLGLMLLLHITFPTVSNQPMIVSAPS